jgi:predicted aspartyl protease
LRSRGLFVFLLAATPLAALAGASGTFEAGERGHVLVPVSINGFEARPFVVDTAATVTVLDAEEYQALRKSVAPADPLKQHARGAHGSFAAQIATVEAIALWEIEHRNEIAALMSLYDVANGKEPDFFGILGLPFLGKYRVDLDYPGRTIELLEAGERLPPCDICRAGDAIEIKPLTGGLPTVAVTVNGVKMTALLDTGASRTILNEAAVTALGLEHAGSGEDIASVRLALGPLAAREQAVSRIDLPIFQALRLDDRPALILGIDFLGSGRTVLDLAAGIVWFEPASD